MVVIDAEQELVDMIKANWNDTNTSGVTPTIDKITNIPFEMQFGDDKGYVLIYSSNEQEGEAGIGETTQADVLETIKIDVRFGGMGDKTVSYQETRFLEYKAELKRVLYSNVTNPTASYCILNMSDKLIQNLSNRAKKFFREVREVTMTAYNRNMTA